MQKDKNSWMQVKGTHVNFANEQFKVEYEKNRETVLGAKKDLENYRNKLEETKNEIRFILIGDMTDKEYNMKRKNIKDILNFLYNAKLHTFTELGNPATGGNTAVIALDKDKNILFHIAYDDYWFVVFTEEKEFVFDGKYLGKFPGI